MLNPGDKGADLASYQHPGDKPIDYAQLATYARFAYIQLTDGATYQNGFALADARGCQANKIQTGAYHFFRPDQDTGKQLGDFTKYYRAIGGWTLPPMIDAEVMPASGSWAELGTRLVDFRTNLKTALNTEVGFYVNLDYYENLAGFPWGAPVWLADPSHPDHPSKPCLLQQTGIGTVPGIAAPTDLDVWRTPYGAPAPQPTEDDEMQPMLLTRSDGVGFLVVDNTKVGLPDGTLTSHIPNLVIVPKGEVSDETINAFPNAAG